MNSVHYSHQTDKWFTPEWLYKRLHEKFGFNHDPALRDKINWENDGLHTEWGTRTFCNPPYSQLEEWLAKGYREFKKGKLVVFLIPARTDTHGWHNYAMKSSEIWFVKGRIKFEGAKQGAPFPSCLVIFDPEIKSPHPIVKTMLMNQERRFQHDSEFAF